MRGRYKPCAHSRPFVTISISNNTRLFKNAAVVIGEICFQGFFEGEASIYFGDNSHLDALCLYRRNRNLEINNYGGFRQFSES